MADDAVVAAPECHQLTVNDGALGKQAPEVFLDVRQLPVVALAVAGPAADPTVGEVPQEAVALTIIRAAAAELPAVNLDDALRVCLLLAAEEPEHLERAALRWLGRYCLERRDVTLAQVREAAGAFVRLADGRDGADATLHRLSTR